VQSVQAAAMKMRLFVTVFLLFVALGCSDSRPDAESANTATPKASPTSSPRSAQYSAAFDEEIAQDVDDIDNRIEARKAAADYARTTLPSFEVRGVAAVAYTGNLYIVSVDLTWDKEHKTVTVVSRLFITESGETYWKAEPLTPEIGHALSGLVFQKYQKLKTAHADLESSYEDLRSRDDDRSEESYDDDPRN
jgi:hypothetical protein